MRSNFPVKIEHPCIVHCSDDCPSLVLFSTYLRGRGRSYLEEAFAAQKAHATDWIAMNGTCARFRQVGIVAFFEEKVFVLHEETFTQLYVVKTKSILPTDLINTLGRRAAHWEMSSKWEYGKDTLLSGPCRDTALAYIRHLYLVDPGNRWFEVSDYLLRELPTRLSLFPRLRRLTRCSLRDTCSVEIMCMGNPNPTTPAELKELVESMQRALVSHGMSEQVKLVWHLVPEAATENTKLRRPQRSTQSQIELMQWIPNALNKNWEKISPQPITEYRNSCGMVEKIGEIDKRKSRRLRSDNINRAVLEPQMVIAMVVIGMLMPLIVLATVMVTWTGLDYFLS